jgi:hypothetical protein
MKDYAKRCVAYVVGNSFLNKAIIIYDNQTQRSYPFNGSNLIHDMSEKVYISSVKDENNYKLYQYNSGKYINLSIDGNTFSGIDLETGLTFSGNYNEKAVEIYDKEFEKSFTYNLE